MNKDKQSYKSFADKELRRAISISLKEDYRIVYNANKRIKDAFKNNNILKKANVDYANYKGWWKNHKGGISPILELFDNHIKSGNAPVFFSVSMLIKSSGHTVYIPAPFDSGSDKKNLGLSEKMESWSNTFLISRNFNNGIGNHSKRKVETAIRRFCHALANISYSVRIGDDYVLGYLAKAHEYTGRDVEPIYIPDVSLLSNGGTPSPLKNAAVDDERYLGMASVLYIPIWHNKILEPPEVNNNLYAPVVLMFWSPIPNRWNHLFNGRQKEISDGAYLIHKSAVSSDKKWHSDLSHELSWLGETINIRNNTEEIYAVKQIAVFHALKKLASDGLVGDRKIFKRITHELEPVIDFCTTGLSSSDEQISIGRFLEEHLLLESTSLVNDLKGNGIGGRKVDNENELKIHFDLNGRFVNYKFDQHATFMALPDLKRMLLLGNKVMDSIIKDPIKNIKEHAEKVIGFEIIISSSYLTIRYIQKTKTSSINKIIGDDDGFRRYYAVRRGLSVPSDDGNYGIGMTLFNVLGTIASTTRRFYMSPGGETAWDEIWLPLQNCTT